MRSGMMEGFRKKLTKVQQELEWLANVDRSTKE